MKKSQEVRLRFEEGDGETIEVTPIGNNLYRLEMTPLFVEMDMWFGDIIEAEMQANNVLRFRRVAEVSQWHNWNWILRKDTIGSAPFQAFQQAIEAQNGVWERVMGGIFFVHLPPDVDFDPDAAFKQALAQKELESMKPDA